MKATDTLRFHQTCVSNLRRPWQTFRDGQIWYGYTTRGSKRHQLTTKQGNKHFYKGTGSSGYGKLNKNGSFVMNWSKVRTYVVPQDLNVSNLKPLVSPNVPQIEQKYVGYKDGIKSPELAWKNITDFIEYGENYDNIDLESNNYLEEYVHPKIVESDQKKNFEPSS
ncbi:uncharacterized protein PRCAT00003923001 [Priceomyces carsonii]|uniref:uncharacterized protein n=1 Tax=Priceomyces carsonii TaxID=28549 RepID=UPI002EDA6C1F|nr:unnamed protein product [Priceomyces carsonii]